MRSCPACGASAPADAAWCGQCFATFPPAVAAPVPVPVSAADGWATPVTAPAATLVAAPPPPAPAPAPAAATEPPRVSTRTGLVALVAIGVGGVMQVIAYAISRDTHLTAATDIRYSMVLTLALYAVVGVLVAAQVVGKVRLRWSDGRPALGIAIGLLIGGGLSGALLAIVSAAAGRLEPDPRVVLLMSEGDAAHIVVAVLVACVAAPLVEETLFRGLLLESLRRIGRGAAIWLSALAFAVWHFAPSSLRYYAVVGALLGLLYVKRGLACSMAAHVGFNGVLTVAALSVVLSPGPTVDVQGLSVHLPGGWHASDVPSVGGRARPMATFAGPSASTLAIATMPLPTGVGLDQLVAGIDLGFGRQSAESRSMRELQLPVGTALELQVDVAGHPSTVAVVPHDGTLYEFELDPNGSVKATADFQRMLDDLTAR